MICCPDKPCCTRSLLLIAAGWFLIALFVGEIELLAIIPGPATQVTLASLTIGLLIVYWRSRAFRSWVQKVDLRHLILLHLTRFVGIYFLALHARGELPAAFAITAGWGDIAAASGALFLVLSRSLRQSRGIILAWNTFSLLDILIVVGTAATLAFGNRESMMALTRLPLSFLPTLIVPLIISTHIIIFLRLRKPQDDEPRPEQQTFALN